MTKYEAPQLPYVESRYQGGKQKPTAIILRGTMTTSDEGAALGLAQMWHRAPSPWKSGHYTVDARKMYRCTPDDVVAGNDDYSDPGAIRIAVCGEPCSNDRFWHEEMHMPVIFNTAKLVAELSLVYKIKVAYLDESSRARWEKRPSRRRGGIIVDTPSGWPFETFLSEVNVQRALKTVF